MNMLKLFVVLFMISVANLLAQSDDWSKVRSMVQEHDKKFSQAMISGDVQSINDMYTSDAISLPSYSPMLKGKDAIRDASKKDVDMGTKYNDFQINQTEFFGDGKLAYEIGTYTVDMTMPNMPNMGDVPAARENKMQNIKDHGKYLNVWEKQSDGSWKIKAEIWNSDLNPWQEMSKGETHTDQNK